MSAGFTPGPLSNRQRSLIMRAADGNNFLNSFDIETGEWSAFNGLLDRGFFKFATPADSSLFELTDIGQRVAVAVRKLRTDRTGYADPRDFLCPRAKARGEQA